MPLVSMTWTLLERIFRRQNKGSAAGGLRLCYEVENFALKLVTASLFIDIILQQTESAAVPLLRSPHPRTLLRAGGARAAPGVQAAASVQRRRRRRLRHRRLAPAATVSPLRKRFHCAAAVRVRATVFEIQPIANLKRSLNIYITSCHCISTESSTHFCVTKKE